MPEYCCRFDQVRPVEPGTQCRVEGEKAGDAWAHLHLYLACGHVDCSDSSMYKRATRHFHAPRHPVMRSPEPGEAWGWCHVHTRSFDAMPFGSPAVADRGRAR